MISFLILIESWLLEIQSSGIPADVVGIRYKLLKVKIINKSRTFVPHEILPFSVQVQANLIKMGSWV